MFTYVILKVKLRNVVIVKRSFHAVFANFVSISFNCIAGKVEFTGNLTYCFAVSKISQTDFGNGLHDQHLLLKLLSILESREYGAGC